MSRILIVDDSPILVRLLEYMLQSAGYETETVPDGQAALDSIARRMPAMVFLDVMMPDMDGLEVLQRIRANPHSVDLPVVMLTAKAQKADRETALREGADAYLTKPYTSEQVLDAVRRYAEGL